MGEGWAPVSVWEKWWWVLTSPGSTTWGEASKVASMPTGVSPRLTRSAIRVPSTTSPRSALSARMANGFLIQMRMMLRACLRSPTHCYVGLAAYANGSGLVSFHHPKRACELSLHTLAGRRPAREALEDGDRSRALCERTRDVPKGS